MLTNVFAARLSMLVEDVFDLVAGEEVAKPVALGGAVVAHHLHSPFRLLAPPSPIVQDSVSTGNTWSARDAIGTMKYSSTTPWLTASSATLMAR